MMPWTNLTRKNFIEIRTDSVNPRWRTNCAGKLTSYECGDREADERVAVCEGNLMSVLDVFLTEINSYGEATIMGNKREFYAPNGNFNSANLAPYV